MTETLLAVLLVVTNTLWAINTHRLINKLMSRTFYDYKEATLQDIKVKAKINEKPPMQFDEPDYGSLSEVIL